MKQLFATLLVATSVCLPLAAAEPQLIEDVSHIDVYVTPYYNSEGPVIRVPPYSAGLASTNEAQFTATIAVMKTNWDRLSFPEMYVATIRLYDLGYRKESVYWFYSAQYRARQFAALADAGKPGSLGDEGFELKAAGGAFHELTGPYINGYAFEDMDGLTNLLLRVQREGRHIPDLQAIYPGVAFRPKNEWSAANDEVANGMGRLISTIMKTKEDTKRQRLELGTHAKFSKLTNKELPGR